MHKYKKESAKKMVSPTCEISQRAE